jgi:DNA-binding LacI/PurR family transcriptional regulator
MRDCNVSQVAVGRVLDELEDEGVIERIPRRGAFKRAGVETSRFVPMIDLIYCGTTYDVQAAGTGFHSELIDALARQFSRRHQGIRVHQFPLGAGGSDFAGLFDKPDLRACIVVGLESIDLAQSAREHRVAWISLFPQAFVPSPNTILINAEDVVRRELEHLWELGHRRIAFLHLVDEKVYHRDLVLRREAFYKLMAERGLPVRPNWVVYGHYLEEPFRGSFRQLFETSPRPTAVILGDPNLPWAYRVLREMGLQVGKDVSLVGTDDLILAAHLDPPATTLRVSRPKAAEMAVNMLDRVIASPEETAVEYLPVELIVRGSTGPAPKE